MAEAARAGPGGPGWGDVRQAVLAAVSSCEAAVAALRDGTPAAAAAQAAAALRDLGARVTPLAWDEEVARMERARAYDRGYAAGFALAARRRPPPRHSGPRPPWPRAAGD